jgi:hypothetical protein
LKGWLSKQLPAPQAPRSIYVVLTTRARFDVLIAVFRDGADYPLKAILKQAAAKSERSDAMATLLRSAVLNPEGYRTVKAAGEEAGRSRSFASLAPRLDSLNGKTVYLVDTGFGGSGKFLDSMQAWFAERMPSVTTVRRRKTGNIFRDDTKDLWAEIKEHGQAAILGVAG